VGLTAKEVLILKEQVRNLGEVELVTVCHRHDVTICFGLFQDAENFTVLLDELQALFTFRLDKGLLSLQNPVAVRVAAEASELSIHVGTRIDFFKFFLVQLQVRMRVLNIGWDILVVIRVFFRRVRHGGLSAELRVSVLVDCLACVIDEGLSIAQQSVRDFAPDGRSRLRWHPVFVVVLVEPAKSRL